jgi:hypothetical protein
MSAESVRMLHRGVPLPLDSRRVAVLLVIIMFLPIINPVTGDESAGRDDFGVLETMTNALAEQRDSGEDELAHDSAEAVLSALESRGREIGDGDALLATDGIIGDISMRDTSPLEASHPRPYVFLTEPDSHPEGWPSNLLDTLFELPPDFSDPLAFGVNTFSLYVNYSARNNGPQYEAWDYGTFTGDVFSLLTTDTELFENPIDIDGDGSDDVAVGLSIAGLGQQGEGWGVTWGEGLIPGVDVIQSIWIRPNFQWKVRVLDYNDALWDDMASMEVSLMKGIAYDLSLSTEGESYALVIDSRFTQPPHDFEVRVGLDQMTLNVTGTFTTIFDVLNLFSGGDDSGLEIAAVSAPYSIMVSNPNRNSANEQTDCDDSTWYDPDLDHDEESRFHKCGYSIGIGYVHFDQPDSSGERALNELGYIDVGLHPIAGSTLIPEEVDLVIRNDNTGENSFDNIEIFSDTDADLWFHYFEDRSRHIEEGGRFGNITDSRGWVRDMPKGTLPQEEIDAIFTLIGEAPGSTNFPGEMPNRLSLIISIKNYTADNSVNADDGSLVFNPSDDRWNSLILIAGTERIGKIEYVSTFQRHGYGLDSSSLMVEIIDLPEVVVVFGTFEIPSSNRVRVEFGTAPDLLSEVLDNVILNLVEIVLDLGTILNGLPNAIVGSVSESSGEIIIQCYNQIRSNWNNGNQRSERTIGRINLAIGSSPHPVMSRNHILLAEDIDNSIVNGKYGAEQPLVPVGMSVLLENVSGVAYSYDQQTDLRKISLSGISGEELIIGHLNHLHNTTDGDVKQFASISNRPENLTISQQGTDITYLSTGEIGTITYSGEGGGQYNALRLNDLPSQFELKLGDTLAFIAPGGVGSVEVQISNATIPLTMDGDHARFWIDQNSGEASMSLKLSNLTSVILYPPDEPGALGPRGNSQMVMNRTGSAPFSVLLEDVSEREDQFLGLSGRVYLDPLPANVTFSLPSSQNSAIISAPEFGEADGVLSLSFFLSGMIDFGASVNDFAIESMVDLGDASNIKSNMSIGLDLITGEEFDLTLDIAKGVNIPNEPRWVHGLTGEVLEATELKYNYSRMPSFTESSRLVVSSALEDMEINETERADVIEALEWGGLSNSTAIVDVMEDGYVSAREMTLLDLDTMASEGLELEQRRSWHSKIWMPQLPGGRIQLSYEVTIDDDIPTFEINAELDEWTPARPVLTIELNGLARTDSMLVLSGLDTDLERDIELRISIATESELIIPRTTIDMNYDMGERMDSTRVLQNNKLRGIRTELMLFDAPASATLYSKIGDILQADLNVPPADRIGLNAADSLMLQQLRRVDGLWWPSTMFIRDVPGEMHLLAKPASDFDINEVTSFQGMFEMSYSSNSDEMDLFIETKGKSQNTRSSNLMLAENLPDRFSMEVTEDFGARISASGNGVEKLYIRRSDTLVRDGVQLITAEMVGENLQGAEVHQYMLLGYPVIVIDGITGGRIVATAHTEITVLGMDIDARGVLLDAQFTGGIPTASSLGVNGVVTDLSLISSLTGGKIETTHIMIVDPFSSLIATGIAAVTG